MEEYRYFINSIRSSDNGNVFYQFSCSEQPDRFLTGTCLCWRGDDGQTFRVMLSGWPHGSAVSSGVWSFGKSGYFTFYLADPASGRPLSKEYSAYIGPKADIEYKFQSVQIKKRPGYRLTISSTRALDSSLLWLETDSVKLPLPQGTIAGKIEYYFLIGQAPSLRWAEDLDARGFNNPRAI